MSLSAHYKLNDNAANTVVADASGNGHDGTASSNTSTLSISAKVALGFDLSASAATYIDVTGLTSTTQSYTFAAWVWGTRNRSHPGV
ncbi:MAG: hypothetical protein KKE86_16185 [Planctomycetes bacterium]|nr:hypothetical protein [Planctomycetota bacterium]MBU4400855.1 hypothetical protein [Planctomycetota bacterium]MCG2685438.1 hypothetical protein [Planctomycetales bacterium]